MIRQLLTEFINDRRVSRVHCIRFRLHVYRLPSGTFFCIPKISNCRTAADIVTHNYLAPTMHLYTHSHMYARTNIHVRIPYVSPLTIITYKTDTQLSTGDGRAPSIAQKVSNRQLPRVQFNFDYRSIGPWNLLLRWKRDARRRRADKSRLFRRKRMGRRGKLEASIGVLLALREVHSDQRDYFLFKEKSISLNSRLLKYRIGKKR